MTRKSAFGIGLALALPLIAILYPQQLDLSARLALGLSAFTVVMWTFEPVPIEYSSLLLLLLLPLLRVVEFETAFAAFSGKAVWLIFSGMALSQALTETPLAARLARVVLTRMRGYAGLLAGVHAAGLLSAFLIPSAVVRVLIFMPLLVGLLRSIGQQPGSRASAALVLAFVCSTYYGGTGVLTAGVPNLVVFGVMESRGIPIYWAQWAAYVMPVIGVLRVCACYLLIRILLPLSGPLRACDDVPEEAQIPRRITPEEAKVVCILLAGVLLWATDTLHGVHPAYVGLLLVLACYLPGWGPVHPSRLRQVNFPILIYIAAALAIGAALERTGFSTKVAVGLASLLERSGSGPALKLMAVAGSMLPFNFLGDTAAVAAVFTPIHLDLASRIGMAALPTALTVAIAASMVCIPYQAAPFVLAYSYRCARMGQFIRLMALLSLTTFLILLPVNLVYWRLIGLI